MPNLQDFKVDINGKKIQFEGNEQLRPANCELPLTLQHIEEFNKCKNDILYFAENYFYIIDLDKGKTLIQLRDYQKDLLIKFVNHRFNIVLASRQIGKTTVYTIFLTWYILFHSDKATAILGNKESTAIEILSRIRMSYQMLPKWLQQGVINFSKKAIYLENESKIYASSTSSSALRGTPLNIVVLDEFAFVPPNVVNDFISSVFPTITSSKESKIILVSTLNGKNHFWKMYREAEEKKSPFIPTKVLWTQVPGRDEKWAEETKATLGEDRFNEEFNCIPNAAEKNSLIPVDILNQIDFVSPLPSVKVPLLDNDFILKHLYIYELPKQNHIYSIGVDPSRMNSQKNNSSDAISIQVVDISQYPLKQVAHFFIERNFDYYDSPEIINALGLFYNYAYVFIENNDIGIDIARDLFTEYEYENIFFEKAGEPGFRTTKRTRVLGVQKLKSLIKDFMLNIIDYETIFELSTFIHKGKGRYEAKEGHYDDAIFSLIASLYFLQIPDLKDIPEESEIAKMQEKIKRLNQKRDEDLELPEVINPDFEQDVESIF